MNPFMHNPIAAPCAAVAVPAPRWRRALRACRPAAGTQRLLARSIGHLALAAGLSLAATPSHALDVNTATAAELETLRGVGPRTAETIIKERDRGGKYTSIDDLSDRVRGIGPRKAQALQAAGLSVGTAATQGGAAASPAGRAAGGAPQGRRP